MKKRVLALALVMTMCVGAATTTASAATKTNATSVTQTVQSTQTVDSQQSENVAYKVKLTKANRRVLKKLFNAKEYAQANPDVYKAYGNNKNLLWKHFITYGIYEGRSLNEDFNILAYSAAYPDLKAAFGNDIVAYYKHYLQFGKKEAREITTVDKAIEAGIEVTGMDGSVIESTIPVKKVASVSTVQVATSNNSSSETQPVSNVENNTDNASDANNENTSNEVSTPSTDNSDNTNAGNTAGDVSNDNTSDTTPSTPDKQPAEDTPEVCEHGDYTYEQSPTEGKHYRICGKCHEKEEVDCGLAYIQLDNDEHILGCPYCGDTGDYEPEKCNGVPRHDAANPDSHKFICFCGRVMGEGKCEYEYSPAADEHVYWCKICKDILYFEPHAEKRIYYAQVTDRALYDYDYHYIYCEKCGSALTPGDLIGVEKCTYELKDCGNGEYKEVCTGCGHVKDSSDVDAE